VKKILIIVLIYLISSGISFSKIINTTNILEHLDICKTKSSLGPRCKDINFNYKNFLNSGKKTTNNNTVNYEVDEWNYNFEIVEATDSKTIIKFTDKAKYASYYTVSLILLEKNTDLKWKFISNEIIYPKSEENKIIKKNIQNFDRNFLIKFDGICVRNIDDLKRIKKYANDQKWTSLPDEKSTLIMPKVKGPGYAAYGFKEDNQAFLIAVNDADRANVCSMATKYESIEKIKTTLNEFYKLRPLQSFKEGIQTYEFYKVELLGVNKTIISLTFSKELNYEFISISIIKDM
jgi:hypothetical protein